MENVATGSAIEQCFSESVPLVCQACIQGRTCLQHNTPVIHIAAKGSTLFHWLAKKRSNAPAKVTKTAQ